jgi:lambda family phage portal protein
MTQYRVSNRKIEVHDTLLDKVIGYLDPIRARQRLAARVHLALAGGYSGASRSKRSLSQWMTGGRDADSDILWDLPTLRDRSRDLLRNSPLACGAVNTVVTNVIGQGMKLQCRIDRNVLKMDDDAAEAWESATELEWQMWSASQECDVARTLTFNDIQNLTFRQVLENGDVFILMPRYQRGNSPYLIKLQVIEADRVCNPNRLRDTETLAGGVEKDVYGAPIQYHIMRQHPGNILYANAKTYEWDAFPAFGANTGLRNVIHLFPTLRPGQTRGVPYLAPVIDSLKQLDRYTEAELMAAVVSGMFTVFVETERGTADFGTFAPSLETGGSSTDEDYKLGNGAIVGLAPGEKVSTSNPGRPNQAFDPFVKAILQQIGVALEIPYEVLIHHFSSSYSASRAALLESWRFFRNRRAWLARNFCQLVYENWLTEAIALGRVKAPGFFRDYRVRHAYLGTLWIGDAPGQIDPLKEADAAEKRLSLGLSTVDEETVAITGGDFDHNYPRIVKERRMLQKIGLWQPGQKGSAAPEEPQPDDQQPDEEGDGHDETA